MSNPIAGLFTWKLHGDGKTLKPGEVVEPDERLTWPRTAEIGAQHVIAMFGATFLVPILTGFDPSTTCSYGHVDRAVPADQQEHAAELPGSSFGFIAPIAAVASAHKGLAVASFGIMVTGILLALIGVLVHYAGASGSTSSCRRSSTAPSWPSSASTWLRACGTTSKSLPTPPSSPSSRCCSSQCCSRVCSADSTSSSA